MIMEKRCLSSQYWKMQEERHDLMCPSESSSFFCLFWVFSPLLIHLILVFPQSFILSFPARTFPLYPNLAKLEVLDFFSCLCLNRISIWPSPLPCFKALSKLRTSSCTSLVQGPGLTPHGDLYLLDPKFISLPSFLISINISPSILLLKQTNKNLKRIERLLLNSSNFLTLTRQRQAISKC